MSDTPKVKHLTALGFDFGLKHIGVAVARTETGNTQALSVIKARDGKADWPAVESLLNTWQPDVLVVGIPLNMDGSDNHITGAARRFATKLHNKYQLPVHQIDERLTTVEAKAQLFEQGGYRALEKSAIDMESAKLILESWLTNPRHYDE